MFEGIRSENSPVVHTEIISYIDGHEVRLKSAGRVLKNGKTIPSLSVDQKDIDVFNEKSEFQYAIIQLLLEEGGWITQQNLVEKLKAVGMFHTTSSYEYESKVKSAIDAINNKTKNSNFRILSEQDDGANKRTTGYKLKIGE